MKIWDELQIIQAIPDCTCHVAAGITKYLENQRLIQFLMGLMIPIKFLEAKS